MEPEGEVEEIVSTEVEEVQTKKKESELRAKINTLFDADVASIVIGGFLLVVGISLLGLLRACRKD